MDFHECKYEVMSNKKYTSRQNNIINALCTKYKLIGSTY